MKAIVANEPQESRDTSSITGAKLEHYALMAVQLKAFWQHAETAGATGLLKRQDIAARFKEVVSAVSSHKMALQILIDFYRDTFLDDSEEFWQNDRRQAELGQKDAEIFERRYPGESEKRDYPKGHEPFPDDPFLTLFNIVGLIPLVYEKQFGKKISRGEFEKILRGKSGLSMMLEHMQNETESTHAIGRFLYGLPQDREQRFDAREYHYEVFYDAEIFEFDNSEDLNFRIKPAEIVRLRGIVAATTKDIGNRVRVNCPALYTGKTFPDMIEFYSELLIRDYVLNCFPE